MNFISISWQKLEKDTILLAKKIEAKKIHLNEIISISRGGMVVSRILSDILSLPISHIAVESYSDLKQHKEPEVLQESPRHFSGENVLLVDELTDTGKTFVRALSYLQKLPLAKIYTVSPYLKPQASYTPDFWLEKVEGWVILPYELRETKEAFVKNLGSLEGAEKKLHQLGILDWEKVSPQDN